MATINTLINDKQIIAALWQTQGLLYPAAKLLGIHRSTLSDRIEKSKTLAAEIEQVRQSVIDLAENRLFELISQWSIPAIIFFLKTKAKDRGYVERIEHAGSSDRPFEIVVKWGEKEGVVKAA
jgi:hypothetical protein